MKPSNTRSRVLRVIKSNGDKEWTAREIAERIGQKPDNVAYHLRSLAKDGEIAKIGAGRYSKSRTGGRDDLPKPVVNDEITAKIDNAVSAESITAALWSELLGVPVNDEMYTVLNRVQTVVESAVNRR
jgi:predicted transcriptional regulator